MDDDRLAETVEYVAIRRLQDAYADVVTRRAWDELGALFVPDAVVELDLRNGETMRLDGPDTVRDFIADALPKFEFFEFVILNTVIEIGPGADAATGRMYMAEIRTERASGRWTNAFGVYHDRYRRSDAGWRFEHRLYHSLARTAPDVLTEVFEFPHHLRHLRQGPA